METKPNLTQEQVAFAATNSPELASRKVKLGDREFPILALGYDDNLVFMAKLEPVMTALMNGLAANSGLSAEVFSVQSLLKHCAQSLPEMAQIVLRQSDPNITVEEVKCLGRSPFKLASVVVAQMQENETIEEIAGFFAQTLGILKALKERASMIRATL